MRPWDGCPTPVPSKSLLIPASLHPSLQTQETVQMSFFCMCLSFPPRDGGSLRTEATFPSQIPDSLKVGAMTHPLCQGGLGYSLLRLGVSWGQGCLPLRWGGFHGCKAVFPFVWGLFPEGCAISPSDKSMYPFHCGHPEVGGSTVSRRLSWGRRCLSFTLGTS